MSAKNSLLLWRYPLSLFSSCFIILHIFCKGSIYRLFLDMKWCYSKHEISCSQNWNDPSELIWFWGTGHWSGRCPWSSKLLWSWAGISKILMEIPSCKIVRRSREGFREAFNPTDWAAPERGMHFWNMLGFWTILSFDVELFLWTFLVHCNEIVLIRVPAVRDGQFLPQNLFFLYYLRYEMEMVTTVHSYKVLGGI